MNTFTVSFFGHRRLESFSYMEQELEKLISKLLQEKEYVEFLVGRDGEFDQLASSVIRRCKRTVRSDNSSHVLVLPYATAELRNNQASFEKYYDQIEVCAKSAKSHFKAAHQIRNRSMIDRSELVIFGVERMHGGAYEAMLYAIEKEVSWKNVGNKQQDG